jgi:hypothetical protein
MVRKARAGSGGSCDGNKRYRAAMEQEIFVKNEIYSIVLNVLALAWPVACFSMKKFAFSHN